jgi:hypothetical protein
MWTPRTVGLALLIAGVLAGRVQATDHAAVAASLKGEDAQCRYLLQACRMADAEAMGDIVGVMSAQHGHAPNKCLEECTRVMGKVEPAGKKTPAPRPKKKPAS